MGIPPLVDTTGPQKMHQIIDLGLLSHRASDPEGLFDCLTPGPVQHLRRCSRERLTLMIKTSMSRTVPGASGRRPLSHAWSRAGSISSLCRPSQGQTSYRPAECATSASQTARRLCKVSVSPGRSRYFEAMRPGVVRGRHGCRWAADLAVTVQHRVSASRRFDRTAGIAAFGALQPTDDALAYQRRCPQTGH